jgi:predicted RNA-binding protein (TIGR00451 family)
LLVSDEITCVQVKDQPLIPFLGVKPEVLAHFPSVKVDMGAVKFVCNGAKVLRPGIVEFGNFKKGDIVTVLDQTHGKWLAVGIALEDSESAKMMQKGYVIDNLHYVSDKIWQAYKEI